MRSSEHVPRDIAPRCDNILDKPPQCADLFYKIGAKKYLCPLSYYPDIGSPFHRDGDLFPNLQ